MPKERVLVVPTARLGSVGDWTGFRPLADAANIAAALFDTAAHSYQPRPEVETDFAYKQLIPYGVLRRGDEVFVYRRGERGSETRLHARWSLGIGGHIDETEREADRPWEAALVRELAEEIGEIAGLSFKLVGFLHDPRTDVGRVHIGLIYTVEIPPETIVIARDPALVDAGFRPTQWAHANLGDFESWSQFVLEALAAGRLAE